MRFKYSEKAFGGRYTSSTKLLGPKNKFRPHALLVLIAIQKSKLRTVLNRNRHTTTSLPTFRALID